MTMPTIIAKIIVAIAWCIPGRAHRWAKRVRAQRKAAIEACKAWGLQ